MWTHLRGRLLGNSSEFKFYIKLNCSLSPTLSKNEKVEYHIR